MLFKEKLEHALKVSDSLLCVGLDSDAAKIPPYLLKRRNPQYIFNREIINRTAKFVCAFKPNAQTNKIMVKLTVMYGLGMDKFVKNI